MARRTMMIRVVALTAALALAAAVPADYTDTTDKQISHAQGYTFGSNVAGYLRLSTDVCDIKAAIGDSATPDYTEAKAIYTDGRNSFKSDGTVRSLRALATTPYVGEPVYDMYADYFGSPAFLDQPVSRAFAGAAPYRTVGQRNETIVKGLESGLQTLYMLHELDEAAAKIAAGDTSAAKGAPHNVDETWAIYAGMKPDCSLWGASHRRGREFGTMKDCDTSEVNAGMLAAHRAMYSAASEGNLAAFEAARRQVVRMFIITYVQATLKYAELMDRAAAKGDLDTQLTDQAEGYAFFRTIEPFVAAANNRTVATVASVMSPANPPPANAFATVKAALEAAYPKLGITAAEVGTFGSKAAADCGAPTAAAPAAAAGAPGGAKSAKSSAAAVAGSSAVAAALAAATALMAALL